MGATRSRIIRQLLVESVLLTLAGAALGLAAAPLALGLMRTLLPGSLAGTAAVQIDLRVLAFALGLAVTTGIVFGLWPALGTSRVDPGEAIKSGGGHGATSARLGATRRVLLSAELMLTTMLLVGSGLMLKSFHRLVSQDFGMQPEGVGTVEMAFAGAGSVELSIAGTRARRMEIVREVLRRLRADPQITAAGAVNDLPLRGGGGIGIGIELIGLPTPKQDNFPRYLIADSGYFRAMGIPLLSGRLFEASDDTIGERVAIVSKATAEKYWPNMSPLGRTFYWAGDTTHAYAVVGVVADVREGRADDTPGPQLYFSMEERGLSNLALVARSSLPPGQLLSRLTSTVRAVVPAQATFNLRMMDEVIAKSVAPRRTNTLLIGIFGALALVLSAFGVYAVVSFGVAQRSREFGIRAALGADRRDILTLVGTDMALVVLVGLTIGLGGAWALSRVLASLLYEVETHDASIYAVVPLVLLTVTLLAILIPSLRATRVSPTEVMRAE
jgi:predicted permease